MAKTLERGRRSQKLLEESTTDHQTTQKCSLLYFYTDLFQNSENLHKIIKRFPYIFKNITEPSLVKRNVFAIVFINVFVLRKTFTQQSTHQLKLRCVECLNRLQFIVVCLSSRFALRIRFDFRALCKHFLSTLIVLRREKLS